MKIFPDKDDITFGGFILSNIIRSIAKDCVESGDPENFFLALQEAIDFINDSQEEMVMADWLEELSDL